MRKRWDLKLGLKLPKCSRQAESPRCQTLSSHWLYAEGNYRPLAQPLSRTPPSTQILCLVQHISNYTCWSRWEFTASRSIMSASLSGNRDSTAKLLMCHLAEIARANPHHSTINGRHSTVSDSQHQISDSLLIKQVSYFREHVWAISILIEKFMLPSL